jgi:predicted Zn-dependent protease
LTFERAIIDTADAFAPGQTYVALSRCTSLEGIVLLSQITQRSVQTDSNAVQLSKSEKEEDELQKILEEEKKRFWAERLLLYFDCKDLINIPRNLSKLLEEKETDDYAPARHLAKKMLTQAYEIQKVAVKFQDQLKTIVQGQTADMDLLTERCRKAVTYFQQTVVDGMLLPMQQYISGFRIRKAKTFFNNLCGLELDLKLFIENMKKARYNDVPLVKGLVLPVPEREGLMGKMGETGKMGEIEKMGEMGETGKKGEMGEKGGKKRQHQPQQPRIPTTKQSFDLFRQGLSIQEIAKERCIGEITIASHLAEFVSTGELPVTDLVSQETIATLTPWVQAAIAEDNLRLKPIKEAVGEQFSYNDIRFVMNHWLYERTTG